jgi:nicotinate-nucleotide pyrophosphorylase (carboxylating)
MLKKFVKLALEEDIGSGDLTTDSIIPENRKIKAVYNSREYGIIAGLPLLDIIFSYLDKDIKIKTFVQEGDKIKSGQKLAVIEGNARAILTGERLSLNFLQRMSAIAYNTAKFQEKIKHYKTQICATRKTCPNFRIFEKYSVIIGGGSPHRFGLYDGVMIKDNHIKAAGGIKQAIFSIRKKIPHTIKIEIETENIKQVEEALEAKADIIMLDNMTVEQMKEAVNLIDGKALSEASGKITIQNITEIASTGVDYISTSAINAKAGILDIGLDL